MQLRLNASDKEWAELQEDGALGWLREQVRDLVVSADVLQLDDAVVGQSAQVVVLDKDVPTPLVVDRVLGGLSITPSTPKSFLFVF